MGSRGSGGSEASSSPDVDEGFLIWRRLQLSKAKLKGVTEMAALMAGFSVIATVELQITKSTNELLLVSFTVTTALLVSTTMLSIMIATCVLPHIESVAKMESIELAKRSPHEEVVFYIDLAWFLANNVSIFLFIVDVILLCWIKFPTTPAICITAIMVPVLFLLCVFSIIFYRQTVHQKIHTVDRQMDELKALSVKLMIGDAGINGSPQDDQEDESGAGAGMNLNPYSTNNPSSSTSNKDFGLYQITSK